VSVRARCPLRAHCSVSNRANSNWASNATLGCDYGGHLYCFSNFPAIVFVDDFESSDTLAWSATVTP